MACCHVLIVPTFTKIIYSPPLLITNLTPLITNSTSNDVFPEILNGFKFGLICQLVLDEGDEPLVLGDLCDSRHLNWKPASTWRLASMGGDNGYYLLQFSCLEDQLKVAARCSHPLKRGWMVIVQEWAQESDVYKHVTVGPTITLVRWHPPLPFWIKANTDGSARGSPGPSSCGGVFRDCGGRVVGCFSMKLGMGVAFEAELSACIAALDIARAQGWGRIWLESDSTEVVELLHTRSIEVPRKYKASWMRVLGHLEHMEFRVSHIYREGNRVADALASPDVESGWWPHEIPLISELVYDDVIGCVNARIR